MTTVLSAPSLGFSVLGRRNDAGRSEYLVLRDGRLSAPFEFLTLAVLTALRA